MTRYLFLVGGLICVGLGIVGAVLPIMPTVPFLIAAVFCFARSHPEWERRLLEHGHYGPILRNWGERGAIARKFKFVSIAAMAVGAAFSALTIGWPWAMISLAILVVFGTWIWTRPE